MSSRCAGAKRNPQGPWPERADPGHLLVTPKLLGDARETFFLLRGKERSAPLSLKSLDSNAHEAVLGKLAKSTRQSTERGGNNGL